MRNLIRFKLYNLFKQKSFYVVMILILLMGCIGVLSPLIMAKIINKSFDPITLSGSLEIMTSPSDFSLLLGILISLFCTMDISNSTLKNIISRGFSRKKVVLSNFISSIIGVTFIYIVAILLSIIIALIFGKMTGFKSSLLIQLFINYLLIISYTSLYCLISSIISKTSGALIVCIFLNIFGSTALTFIDTLLSFKAKIKISQFWIGSIDSSKPLMAITLAIIYIVGSIIVGMIISNNKEVK